MDTGYVYSLLSENPRKNKSILSKLLILWVIPLIKKGVKGGLQLDHLYKALKKDKSRDLTDKLEEYWEDEVRKAKEKKEKPKLIKALFKQFYGEILLYGFVWFYTNVILICVRPIILAELIKLFADKDAHQNNEIYVYSVALILASFLATMSVHHMQFSLQAIGMRVRIATSSLVYRKITRLSQTSLGQTPAGKVINILSNDLNRFDLLFPVIHALWVMPFQVVVIFLIIWRQVEISAVVGVVTMVLITVPLQGFLAKYVGRLRVNVSKKTDNRVKLMSELVSGVQVIKMHAWEKPFEKLVEYTRSTEMKDISLASFLRGIFSSSTVFSDKLSLFTTLITYVLLGNAISADKVFSIAQAFGILQLAMALTFPLAISIGAETLISIRRLEEFLALEEQDKEDIIRGPRKTGVTLTYVDASWNDRTTLEDIHIRIRPGMLCAIVGPVGAGKSSLLQLLIGELPTLSGSIEIGGEISYSAQQPWLFQSTIRNNILFGNHYDKNLYKKVVKVCALENDFEQFSHGDRTIVGDKGVSLSGGQRARINLARAVYRKADIYLLDDPLSAVDTHVGKHLFNQCICEFLRGKTRILVTHQLQYLKKADLIIVLNDGVVEAQGTFEELSNCNLDFTKILVAADEITTADVEDNAEPESVTTVLNRKLSSSSSEDSRRYSIASSTKMSLISVSDSDSSQKDDNQTNEEQSGDGQNSKPFIRYLAAVKNNSLVALVIFLLLASQALVVSVDQWLTLWTSQEQIRHSNSTIIIHSFANPFSDSILTRNYNNSLHYIIKRDVNENIHEHNNSINKNKNLDHKTNNNETVNLTVTARTKKFLSSTDNNNFITTHIPNFLNNNNNNGSDVSSSIYSNNHNSFSNKNINDNNFDKNYVNNDDLTDFSNNNNKHIILNNNTNSRNKNHDNESSSKQDNNTEKNILWYKNNTNSNNSLFNKQNNNTSRNDKKDSILFDNNSIDTKKNVGTVSNQSLLSKQENNVSTNNNFFIDRDKSVAIAHNDNIVNNSNFGANNKLFLKNRADSLLDQNETNSSNNLMKKEKNSNINSSHSLFNIDKIGKNKNPSIFDVDNASIKNNSQSPIINDIGKEHNDTRTRKKNFFNKYKNYSDFFDNHENNINNKQNVNDINLSMLGTNNYGVVNTSHISNTSATSIHINNSDSSNKQKHIALDNKNNSLSKKLDNINNEEYGITNNNFNLSNISNDVFKNMDKSNYTDDTVDKNIFNKFNNENNNRERNIFNNNIDNINKKLNFSVLQDKAVKGNSDNIFNNDNNNINNTSFNNNKISIPDNNISRVSNKFEENSNKNYNFTNNSDKDINKSNSYDSWFNEYDKSIDINRTRINNHVSNSQKNNSIPDNKNISTFSNNYKINTNKGSSLFENDKENAVKNYNFTNGNDKGMNKSYQSSNFYTNVTNKHDNSFDKEYNYFNDIEKHSKSINKEYNANASKDYHIFNENEKSFNKELEPHNKSVKNNSIIYNKEHNFFNNNNESTKSYYGYFNNYTNSYYGPGSIQNNNIGNSSENVFSSIMKKLKMHNILSYVSLNINNMYDYVIVNGSIQRLFKTDSAMYIYGTLIILIVLLVLGRTFLFFTSCMMASANLHSEMFNKLLKAPMRFFDTNPSGRILNRFSKDIGCIDEVLPRVMLDFLSIFLVMAGILINIAIASPIMIIAIVLIGSLYLKFRSWYMVTAKALKHLEGITKSPVFSHVSSTLCGISTIRASSSEDILIEEFDRHQDVHTSAWYLTLACMNAFGLWLDLIVIVFLAIVTFTFVILTHFTNVNGSSAGLAISQCMVLTGMLQYGIKQLAEVINNLTSVERIMQYTTIENEGPFDTPKDKRPKGTWPRRGNIEFRNLSLKYIEDEPPVLKHLDVVFKPGEKIGIVGRTGAGKSSLISALFRLAPIEGSIIIDRVDINNLGLTDLRKKISIIPQEPILFSETLRYNLDPFDEFDDDKIWDTLELVELKESVDSLDLVVAEGGANFSLGQRQLICLARAILKENKILILDEATANVDHRTDSLIQATIRKLFKDCTVLTIAHRLNTIMDSDKVLVMSFGNIVEFDHPHNLLQIEDGHFQKMVSECSPAMVQEFKNIAQDAYNKHMAEIENE